MKYSDIPLPKAWPERVKSALLNVISMAHAAITCSRSWSADSPLIRVRQVGELNQTRQERDPRQIIVPLRQSDVRYELGFYVTWLVRHSPDSPKDRDDGGYNEFRPHQGIKGKTPIELYSGISHAMPKFNIRDLNLKLILRVAYLHERPHLPVVSLKIAA